MKYPTLRLLPVWLQVFKIKCFEWRSIKYPTLKVFWHERKNDPKPGCFTQEMSWICCMSSWERPQNLGGFMLFSLFYVYFTHKTGSLCQKPHKNNKKWHFHGKLMGNLSWRHLVNLVLFLSKNPWYEPPLRTCLNTFSATQQPYFDAREGSRFFECILSQKS